MIDRSLIDKCYNSICKSICRALCGKFRSCSYEDIQDAIGDAMLELLDSKNDSMAISEHYIYNWIYRASVNNLIDLLRRRNNVEFTPLNDLKEWEHLVFNNCEDDFNEESFNRNDFIRMIIRDFKGKRLRYYELTLLERADEVEVYKQLFFQSKKSFEKYKIRANKALKKSIISYFRDVTKDCYF